MLIHTGLGKHWGYLTKGSPDGCKKLARMAMTILVAPLGPLGFSHNKGQETHEFEAKTLPGLSWPQLVLSCSFEMKMSCCASLTALPNRTVGMVLFVLSPVR